MDWAIVSKMLSRLETLDPVSEAQELERLGREYPGLFENIDRFWARSKVARSFMQTHMPDVELSQGRSVQPGDRIGAWRIESNLGAGGMGEVYLAERADGLFEQGVALKLARSSTPRLIKAFETERKRLSQLEHPNIARIVDGGTSENGEPFMTMEYVDGMPIDAYVRSTDLDRKARLALIIQLCSAVTHAHGRLVLHRDIKHGNVLINADGAVRLIDFGVASLIDNAKPQEAGGPLTLPYAAPEQLLGQTISASTDIFAIGMLSHLLETGALPERQSDGSVAIDAARIDNPDLTAILVKATRFASEERYGSVEALADDLENFLSGFPVSARPISRFARFTKLVSRNKLASSMSAAALAAMVAAVIGISIFAVRADRARDEAELRAEAAEFFLKESNLASDVMRMASNLSQQFMIEDQNVDEADFRRFLMGQAEQTQAALAKNPDSASAQILFVARYLSNRGDYARSSEFLRFLLTEERTPEIRLQEARVIEARNLRELGDSEGAEKLLRDALAWMKTRPYLLESSGYARVALSLAMNTSEEADLEEAVRASLAEATDPTIDASTRAYHYNSLAVLTSKLGEFERTIEYAIQSVELSRQAENTNPVSVNTRSLNLVGYILHFKQDVALARSYWPSEEDVMDLEKGHLRHRSMHRLYEATALQIAGEYEAAYVKARQAHDLAQREYPPGSPYYLTTAGTLVEAGALAGKADEVRSILQSVMSPLEREGGQPHTRGLIARAFLLHADGETEEAVRQYHAIDPAKIAGSLELTYKMDRLKSRLGIL